jgi:hypothetical protein
VTEHEVVWPTGMTDRDPDLSSRPLLFNPQGFLVAILEDDSSAEVAQTALQEAGFADEDLRIYTSEQILGDRERFLEQRSVTGRVVGALTDDPETIELYYGYARDGRSALWVHVPDDGDAKRVLHCLADHDYLHIRHYGHGGQRDFHVR